MSKRDRCESTFGPSGGIRCDKRRGHEGSHGALNGPDWVDHEFSADAMRHENALLLAQVATLTAERDHWKASHASVNATLDAVAASVARAVEAEREVCARMARNAPRVFGCEGGATEALAEEIESAIRARSKP